MRLRDLAVPVALTALLTGCTSTVSVTAALLDSAGSPVTATTPESGYTPEVVRGAQPSAPVPLTAMGENGFVSGAVMAPDDTLVLLGSADDARGVVREAVVRVAPDDTAQVLPLSGPLAEDPFLNGAALGYTPDEATAVAAELVIDSSQGYPVTTGEVEVAAVDLRSGAVPARQTVRLTEPRPRVPEPNPLSVRDVVALPGGGAVVLVDVLAADASGTVYATTVRGPGGLDTDLRLVRLAAGATEPEVVAEFPGIGLAGGLAVHPDGSWAHLVGLTDPDAGDEVTPVGLRTGAVAPETVLCRQGYLGDPVLDAAATTLLVAGTCSDVTTNQEHLYLLTG